MRVDLLLATTQLTQVFQRRCGAVKPAVVEAAFDDLDLAKTGRISLQQFRWIMDAGAYRQQASDLNHNRHDY